MARGLSGTGIQGHRYHGAGPKLKPRWDVHSWSDEDWLGCATVRIFHLYLESGQMPPTGFLGMRISPWY